MQNRISELESERESLQKDTIQTIERIRGDAKEQTSKIVKSVRMIHLSY